MVVGVRVEGEGSEEFAGLVVDDADFEVVDDHDDRGSGVGSADADVVEASSVSEADFVVVVDGVITDPVGGFGSGVWCGFWEGVVGGGWGSSGEGRCGRWWL